MSITLCVDIGNSRIKAGLFNGRILLKTFFISTEKKFKKDISNLKLDQALISTVGLEEKEISFIEKYVGIVSYFDNSKDLPIKNLYNTPQTLGKDRLANAIGAFSLFPDKNVLVIDAGTCITFDFINKNAEFIGGSISPGINMRLKAMHSFTSRLPLIEWKVEILPELIASSTNECILSGAVNGAIEEVKGIIKKYKKQYLNLNILLTGGDSSFFEKELKNGIFADQNLVLKGLNEIHRYKSENI